MRWQFPKYLKQYNISCANNRCNISFYSKNASFPSSLSVRILFSLVPGFNSSSPTPAQFTPHSPLFCALFTSKSRSPFEMSNKSYFWVSIVVVQPQPQATTALRSTCASLTSFPATTSDAILPTRHQREGFLSSSVLG